MMIERWRLCLAPVMGAALLVAATPARAQWADRNTLQAVTLFRMSCMRFAGDPAELRAWIGARHLLPVAAQADAFSPIRPAQAFWANTADGKLVLSSAENGACAVIAQHGRAASFETELAAALQNDKVIVTPVLAQRRPDGSAEQQILHAEYGARAWTLSVTTKAYAASPDQLPQVTLLATKRPAGGS